MKEIYFLKLIFVKQKMERKKSRKKKIMQKKSETNMGKKLKNQAKT